MARPTNDPKTVRLDLRMPPDLVAEIDEWRRAEPDIPPRAEAIRRLLLNAIRYPPELTERFAEFLIEDFSRVEPISTERLATISPAIDQFLLAKEADIQDMKSEEAALRWLREKLEKNPTFIETLKSLRDQGDESP